MSKWKLALDRYVELQAWLGELPPLTSKCYQTMSHSTKCARATKSVKQIGALELFVPVGPRTKYALVGGELNLSSESNSLVVEACLPEIQEIVSFETVALPNETLYKGLSSEFVPGIFDGIDLAARQAVPLESGTLRITVAVESVVASSHSSFRDTTVFLLWLFMFATQQSSEEELRRLFTDSDLSVYAARCLFLYAASSNLSINARALANLEASERAPSVYR